MSIIPNPSRGIPNVFNDKDLSKALESSNVIVSTGGAGSPGSQVGDITVEHGAHVAWSAATTLTLSAYHDVILQTGSRIENDGNGNLVLRADNSGTGSGTVSLVEGSVNFSDSAGTVSIFFNPSVNPAGSGLNSTSYVNPAENYSQFVSGKLTAYMLVNTAFDLQNVRNNPGGTYALGRDIKNVNNSIANFSPIPNFTGLFDGQNLTVSDVTIDAPSGSKSVGLFDTIGPTGIVRNLNLTDVTVNGLNSQFVGTLAGTNAGTISNVSVTGTMLVDSGSTWGVQVGQNLGTISNSSAAVSVTIIPSSTGTPSGGTTSNQPSPGDATSNTASAGSTTINTAWDTTITLRPLVALPQHCSLPPVTSLLPLSPSLPLAVGAAGRATGASDSKSRQYRPTHRAQHSTGVQFRPRQHPASAAAAVSARARGPAAVAFACARGPAAVAIRLRPAGHRRAPSHRDPLHQGRGGAADRGQYHRAAAASRGRQSRLDVARL